MAVVALSVENGFVEVAELSHGELFGQQLYAYWLEVDLTAQFLDGHAEHHVVVESQWWHAVERKPLRFGGIVATLYLADTHQGIVCYADNPFARVAVDGRESVELVYICVSQPRFLEKFALCTLLSRLVDIQKTSGESPMSLERVGSSFNQEYVKAQAVISENHTVGRNARVGIFVMIL